jgi:hypothetical protein
MDRTGEAATELQLTCLRYYGYTPDHPLTKQEAVELIHSFQTAHEAPPAPAAHGVSAATKAAAHRLRLAAEQGASASTSDPARAVNERLEFWQDTCGEAGHMHLASAPVMELYSSYGCRFFPPTREQVQEILQALDAALPCWDRDNPELFYQTLELNFPVLVRRAPV